MNQQVNITSWDAFMSAEIFGFIPAPVFVGLLLVFLVGVGIYSKRLMRSMKDGTYGNSDAKELLQKGVPSAATIKDIEMGGSVITMGVDRRIQVILPITVTPEGSSPFDTVITPYISELKIPQFQPGKQIQVRYDPADSSRVAFEKIMV